MIYDNSEATEIYGGEDNVNFAVDIIDMPTTNKGTTF